MMNSLYEQPDEKCISTTGNRKGVKKYLLTPKVCQLFS